MAGGGLCSMLRHSRVPFDDLGAREDEGAHNEVEGMESGI